MHTYSLIAISIAFIIMGIVFCILSLSVGSDAKGTSNDTSSMGKISSIIFFIIGFITVIVGLLGVIFHKEATKTAIQAVVLVYILLLLILLIIFAAIMKIVSKKDRK